MNRKYELILGVLLLIFAMLTTACSAQTEVAAAGRDSSHSEEESDEHDESDEAHHEDDNHHENMAHAHVDPPTEFANLTNPFGSEHEAIEAGEEIYNSFCVTCHGAEGKGDGPGAEALEPKPANLADGTMMHELSDGYLFWRISKGGGMEPFHSAMPIWETSLTETQRWQVVSYIRTLSGDEAGHDEHMEDEHADEHMEEHSEEADDHHD